LAYSNNKISCINSNISLEISIVNLEFLAKSLRIDQIGKD